MTRPLRLLPLLLAAACGGSDPKAVPPGDDPDGDTSDSGTPDTGGDDLPDCDGAPLPLEAASLTGFTGAEDFAFDADGYLVSVDLSGDLVGVRKDGTRRLILPDLSEFAAGTRFHPDGELLVHAADRGELVAVNPATGGSRVVLGGLEYPNGLEVDAEGFAYVAEQASGRVRRVDTDSGAFTFVAHGLYNPNGLAFSPDEQTLYIGSFGAGVVWQVTRDGEGWTEPTLHAASPESPGVPPNPCAGAPPGTECALNGGYGLGLCGVDELGDERCLPDQDEGACAGLEAGQACTTTLFGEPVSQVCTAGDGGALFCPTVELALSEACVGAAETSACAVDGRPGFCIQSYQGVMACYLDETDFEDLYTAGCVDRAAGDPCEVHDPLYPSMGTCEDGTPYGFEAMICLPEGSGSEHGGLDGVAADHCGNVYVTEFVLGEVWRFPAAGASAERVATLPSSWIPNLRWGNGVGGWERDHLYVMDRDRRRVFDLDIGVTGR